MRQRFQRMFLGKIQFALWSSAFAFPWRSLRGWRFCLRLRGHPSAPLRNHIGIATGIFDETPVTFSEENGRGDPIEKIAIMADRQHGAGIIGDHLLEQIE